MITKASGNLIAVGLLAATTAATAGPRLETADAGRLVLLVSQVVDAATPTNAGPQTVVVDPLIYSVTVNGQDMGDSVLLKLADGPLLAGAAEWTRWNLKLPGGVQYEFEGDTYYALDQAPGYQAQLDSLRQQATLQFSPSAFATSVVSARRYRRAPPQPPSGIGGYLNYEFSGTRQEPENGLATSNVNGLVGLGLFNAAGTLSSQWLGLNLSEEPVAPGAAENPRRAVRLETAWTRDLPDAMQTLRVGDGIGASGMWGRPVRYGGVRWSRNFGTQPGFVTLPQPAFDGENALPSVLDVYVDGLRRQSVELPPGPFRVEEIPTFTGQGEIRVVVRDLLGREQVITDSYISGFNQLKAGLHDFSYETGWTRERFGRVSDDYGDLFAVATHRYGFYDNFTGEGRLELTDATQTAGLGGVFAIPVLGVVSNAFAVSHSDAGYGTYDVLAFQRAMRLGVTVGARLQAASANFAQIGLAPGFSAPLRSVSAHLGVPLGWLGRLGLSYVDQENAGTITDTEAVTATLTARVWRGSLSLSLTDRLEPRREYLGALTLNVPFGRQQNVSTGYRRQEDPSGAWSSQSYAQLQRSLPPDEGIGYRLAVHQQQASSGTSSANGEAAAFLNAAYGSYGLEARAYETLTAYRATVSGGLGAMGGHAFASRKITNSFAVVETDAEDVALTVNGRPAGRTGGDGVAVLPRLIAWQKNRIRVDASDLPMDVEVGTGEVEAVPYARSGLVLPMDVRKVRAALVGLTQKDGAAVPAGALVRLAADGSEFRVGHDGQAYLTGLKAGPNTIDVSWNGQRCRISIDYPAAAGFQPRLGPFACNGNTP